MVVVKLLSVDETVRSEFNCDGDGYRRVSVARGREEVGGG